MVTIGGLQGSAPIPTQYKLIALLLTSLGIQDAEPGVIALLSDFIRSYTTQILHAAIPYVEHAARPPPDVIQADDIRLAIASFTAKLNSTPSREFLQSLAIKVNSVPIGSMGEVFGARVPEARYRLNTNISAAFGRNEGPPQNTMQAEDSQMADMEVYADSILKNEEKAEDEQMNSAAENVQEQAEEDDLFGDDDLDVDDEIELIPDAEMSALIDAAPIVESTHRELDDDYD